ncbi:Hypothetical predicted protein [Cloeon dipterum]|uniref:Protein quiver n=1 Tax=Cloeon dipterum TaxID=197152 RepID=A0A8S1CT44_9INSE|nr:Hypothetical predicted protein [Cloeon dipterum]
MHLCRLRVIGRAGRAGPARRVPVPAVPSRLPQTLRDECREESSPSRRAKKFSVQDGGATVGAAHRRRRATSRCQTLAHRTRTSDGVHHGPRGWLPQPQPALQMEAPGLLFLLVFLAVIGGWFTAVASIDCFKCISIGGNNPECDDPFHNNYSTTILESPCMGGRKGRNGLFPATACIKLAGVYEDNGVQLTVRGCALDSGTLTTDTEIIRMSHCGGFYLDDRYIRGCLQSCSDFDACNGAPPSTRAAWATLAAALWLTRGAC